MLRFNSALAALFLKMIMIKRFFINAHQFTTDWLGS